MYELSSKGFLDLLGIANKVVVFFPCSRLYIVNFIIMGLHQHWVVHLDSRFLILPDSLC